MANPDLTPDLHGSPEEEARQLLEVQGENGLKGATNLLMQQFMVLQTRAQIMLTITTNPWLVPSISFGGLALLGGLVFAIAVGGLAVQRRRKAL